MTFQLSDMEVALFRKLFGSEKSVEDISLSEPDICDEDDDTVYFSKVGKNTKTLFSYQYDVPHCVEEYSILITEYGPVSIILADWEWVAGITILLGITAKPSENFLQNRIVDWWHAENCAPPTRFSLQDNRINSPAFARRLMNNEIRSSYMTDDEFDAWLADNLADIEKA